MEKFKKYYDFTKSVMDYIKNNGYQCLMYLTSPLSDDDGRYTKDQIFIGRKIKESYPDATAIIWADKWIVVNRGKNSPVIMSLMTEA